MWNRQIRSIMAIEENIFSLHVNCFIGKRSTKKNTVERINGALRSIRGHGTFIEIRKETNSVFVYV